MNVTCRVLVLGSLVVAVGACFGWGAEVAADPSLPAGQAGAKIYAAKCASCHAKDGQGNPAMAKVFKVEPEKLSLVSAAALAKSTTDQIKVTTEGSGKMPAYKGKLSDAEIKDVVAYTQTLAPAKK